MRKLLLATAATLALSATAAMATPPAPPSHNDVENLVAVALGVNLGAVWGQTGSANGDNYASITRSANDNRGIVQMNNNAGGSSILQNNIAAAVIDSCACGSDLTLGLAVGINAAGVVGGSQNQNDNGYTNASITESANGNRGVVQASQSAGASSVLQNNLTVGAVLGGRR